MAAKQNGPRRCYQHRNGGLTRGDVVLMAVRQPTLPRLPGKSPLGSYIYVLSFNVGILKVGMTVDPSLRLRQYLTSLTPFGISIVRHWISEPHGQAKVNEAKLLDFCRTSATPVRKGEYFTDIAFGAVVAFADELPKVQLRVPAPTVDSVPPKCEQPAPPVALGTSSDLAEAARAITRGAPVTPYRQLAEILKARIARGDWSEGRPIASENSLVQQYGLARTTVRRAIAALVEERVVWTVQGRGTYVGQPPADS